MVLILSIRFPNVERTVSCREGRGIKSYLGEMGMKEVHPELGHGRQKEREQLRNTQEGIPREQAMAVGRSPTGKFQWPTWIGIWEFLW